MFTVLKLDPDPRWQNVATGSAEPKYFNSDPQNCSACIAVPYIEFSFACILFMFQELAKKYIFCIKRLRAAHSGGRACCTCATHRDIQIEGERRGRERRERERESRILYFKCITAIVTLRTAEGRYSLQLLYSIHYTIYMLYTVQYLKSEMFSLR